MRHAKKLLSLLLVLAMIFAMAVPAFAAEYTVVKGDNLSKIALQYLGSAKRWREIYNANKDKIKNPNLIYVGQKLTIPGAEEEEGLIVILHSNDVHGGIEGYAKMATLKAEYEDKGAYVLVMDAGDFSQGETSVSASQGLSAIDLMNMVGYDVAAPGNHEFDYGYENLKKLERVASFPILAANLTYEGAPAVGTNVTFTAPDGTKIGVFGLDTPETATKAHPAKIKGMTFAGGEEMYAVAQAQVNELKAAGCNYIICLGHLGIDDETAANANRSIDLLAKVTGIDVFIDGHSHSTEENIAEKTNADRTVNGTVVTSTGTKFANIGVITIKNGTITTECVPTADIAADETIAAQAAAVRAQIEAEYGATFAVSEVQLNGAKAPGNRNEETNNGDIITDAMVWLVTKDGGLAVDADHVVGLTNGGGIRAAINVGDVSKNDVNTVLPFGNTVCTVYVKGSVLLEALEASTFCTPDAVGGFPQVSGMNITINTAVAYDPGENYPGTTYAAPASINRVTVNSVNGQPFDPDATYAVVTNDFVAAGGDTYYAFVTAGTAIDTGTPLDEALMQYITEELNGVIPAAKYAAPQGRMSIVSIPAETETTEPDPQVVVELSDKFSDSTVWEQNGEGAEPLISGEKIVLDASGSGNKACVRLTETAKNVTYKFSLQLENIPKTSMEDWSWWDDELLIMARSSVADTSSSDGQTGYCLTAWGDMSEVYVGRAGHDDALGSVKWSLGDGQPHDVELTLTNSEDNKTVTVTLTVDGEKIFEAVDDGSNVKEGRTPLFPDAGGLTIRAKYVKATVAPTSSK